MSTRRRRIYGVVLIVAFVAVLLLLLDPSMRASFVHVFRLKTINDVRQYVRSLGPWGPIAMITLMILHSATFVPAEIITMGDVVIFGPIFGTIYAWIGAMLGAYLSFFLARIVGRPIANRFVPKHLLEQFDAFFKREGVKGIFILRLIPLVSFNALNYASGLTRMTVWEFAWTTGFGILPMEILIAILYRSASDEKYAVVGLTGVGIVLLVGLVLRSKLRKKYRAF